MITNNPFSFIVLCLIAILIYEILYEFFYWIAKEDSIKTQLLVSSFIIITLVLFSDRLFKPSISPKPAITSFSFDKAVIEFPKLPNGKYAKWESGSMVNIKSKDWHTSFVCLSDCEIDKNNKTISGNLFEIGDTINYINKGE